MTRAFHAISVGLTSIEDTGILFLEKAKTAKILISAGAVMITDSLFSAIR